MKAETIEKLREIKRHILEEPKRIDMGSYMDRKRRNASWRTAWPACGTVGCIAGWAVILTDGPRRAWQLDIHGRAMDILGLDSEQANRLFLNEFPDEKPQTRSYARAVARRIEHFIATDGAE